MSCQQASRFITNNNVSSKTNISNNCKQHLNNQNNNTGSNITSIKGNRLLKGGVFQQEDPYVFTESVPTTPPILFNTQKTRTRLNDLITTNTALSIEKLQQPQKQQKSPLTETNGKITTNILKTQASLSSTSSSSTTTSSSPSSLPSTTTYSLTTNTITTNKNGVTQSLTTITTAANNCNSKKLTNVCIVRPQLQQQQPHQQQKQQQHFINEEDLKSISPPPLYTPPTPSLWQTPLLLETTTSPTTTTTTTATTTTTITNAAIPHIGTVVARQQTLNSTPIMGCVTPTVIHTVGGSTTTLSTTAMAKVAPIVVHTSPPLAPPPPPLPKQCLPPSKFHNHTLAQHLQKVECLKKFKKIGPTEKISACHENFKSATPTSTTPIKVSCNAKAATPLKTMVGEEGNTNVTETLKHSENEELNEIPVNVIFRMAVVSQQQQQQQQQQNEKSNQNVQFVRPAPSTQQQQQIEKEQQAQPTSSITPSLQLKATTHVNRKSSSIPASKITTTTNQLVKQQNHTSSMQQQQKYNTTTALNFDNSKRLSSQKLLVVDEENVTTTNTAVTKLNIKTDTPTHISHKSRKSNSPSSIFPSSCTNSINFNYNLPSYSWQMGSSTTKGAVAIVKMSQHNLDLDITHLATASGLPYCLQQFWLDTNNYDFRKSGEISLDPSINRSLAREERIALYKQQLRRQAMQLLSTRSLQKLPMQIARRRLMCVDRLLKKYQHNEQNKKELPANVKRCCVDGCDAYTLEMASHCQQHIVYNSAQHVFLPCTAKFADNTQCRIPVFDITHDLPLCIEHARKRDAYNRLLYEQRPRKISTNPIIKHESITSTSSVTTSNIANTEETCGMKNQQPHKHILQQLSPNNRCNGNKRPSALVNQRQQQQTRKRKMTNGSAAVVTAGNPLGRPQKRVKKTLEKSVVTATVTKVNATTINTVANIITNQKQQMPRSRSSISLKRKSSSTSLESLTSNSQHSTASSSCTSQQSHLYGVVNSSHVSTTTTATVTTTLTTSLPPPALAPLSSNSCVGNGGGLLGHGLPQHLFSFGHDNKSHQHNNHSNQPPQLLRNPISINDKHSFNSKTPAASTPTELKDFISQFALIAAQKSSQNNSEHHSTTMSSSTCDVNLLNTNSNSNFTSSGMGSTSSLPTADDFLTQDMLSICENSSASSADTGLGGLSDPELMLGGPEDDIPLGDTHLLEEHDLENVLNSLPEDAFKELFTTVHQDESDEIERAIELADKHLKTLQQTIGSELGDFLDFNDDMLMDSGGDLCNETTITGNSILDTTALFIDGGGSGNVSIASGQINAAAATAVQGGGGVVASVIGTEIRSGLVQT